MAEAVVVMKRHVWIFIALSVVLLLPSIGAFDLSTSSLGLSVQDITKENDTMLLSENGLYTGNGDVLDVTLTGVHTSNSSTWTMSTKSYALDYSQGTTYSVINASDVVWSALVQVSPPIGVTDVEVIVEYPLTDWVPTSVINPLGVAQSYPSEWMYASGKVFIPSSTIDSDGLWKIDFTGINYLFDLKLGEGLSLGTTAIFDIPDLMTFESTTPWINGAGVEFDLIDPNSNVWYSSSNTTSSPTAHFLQSFLYRKTITIDNTKVFADLVNFPVLIDLIDTDLKTDVQVDGDDIVFVSNNVILDHQIELFDQSYSPTQARLTTWVKANLSNSVDTILTMYYGNSFVESQEHSQDTWTSNFDSVWHLNEPATNEQTSAIHYDSTYGGYDGNQDGNARTAGRVSYGQDFDGSNDLINVTEEQGLDPSGHVTLSGWFRLNSAFTSSSTTSQLIIEKYVSGSTNFHLVLVGTDYTPPTGVTGITGTLLMKVENTDVRMHKWTTIYAWSANTWYHFVCAIDSTNALNNKIYINGADVTSSSYSGTASPLGLSFAADWGLGGGFVDTFNMADGDIFLSGRLDEIRVASTIRAGGWISTEYANQLSPSTFYSVGSESARISPDLSIKRSLDASALAGLWTVSAKYNDSGSSVAYRVGYYERQFIVRHSSTLTLDSPGDAIGDDISVRIAGELLYVEVNLTDAVTLDGITGSAVTMNWTVAGSGTVKTLNDLGDGRYGLALNTSDLVDFGRWIIDIQSSHPYYTGATTFFYLDLYHDTVLTYEDVSTTPLGFDFSAILVYRDTFDNSPITSATITFANGTPVTVVSQSNGRYNISLPSSSYNLGKHWFILNATKSSSYYTMASTNVTFTLRAHYTAVSVQGDLITPFGQNTSLTVVLIDLDTGASVAASDVASFSLVSSYGTQPDAAADFLVILDTDSWSVGTTAVTLSVVMSNSNYKAPSNYAFNVQIRAHYTSVSVTGVLTQPYGNNTPVTVVLTDLDTGTLVDISDVASFSFASSYGTQPDGATDYQVTLTTTTWAVGTTVVTLSVTMSGSNYIAPSNYNFNVVIRKLTTIIYNEPSDLIFPNGDNFNIILQMNVSELGIHYGAPVDSLTAGEFTITNGTFTYPKTVSFLTTGRYNLTISSIYFPQGTFTITVTVNPSSSNYASCFVVLTFNYRPARSFLSSPSYPQVTTPFDIDVTISLNYTDVDRSLSITGALIQSTGLSIYGQSYSGGLYYVTLNVTGLAKGNHLFNITASAADYESKTLTFTLTIRIAYTYAIPTVGALNIPLGNDPVFYVVYWDTDSDVTIADALISTTWAGSLSPLITYESGNQRYRVEFRTDDTDTLQQNTVVTFNFSKGANYQFGIFTISVTIRTHNTDFRLVSAVEPTSFNGIVNISVYYGDLDNNVGITPISSISASVVNTTGSVSFSLVDDPQGDGYYILRIDASQFGLGTQTFNVTFSWSGGIAKYQTKWLIATVNIIGEDSRLTLMVASDPTPYLENMSYIFFFSDLAGSGITNTSNPYGDGNVLISVSFQGISVDLNQVDIFETNYLSQPGNYSIRFNTTIFGKTGLVYMNIQINWTSGVAPYYTNRFDVISVRILTRDTLVSIIPPSPTSYNENATFSFTFDDVTGGSSIPIDNSSSLFISMSLADFSISYESISKIFTISFNTSQFGAPLGQKSFTLNVVWLGEPFYSNRTGRTIYLTVIARQTVLDYQSPSPTQYLDNVTFTVTWTDVTGAAPKDIAGATLILYDGINPVNTNKYSWMDNGDGTYTIELNTTYKTSPGTYDLRVLLTHPNFYYLDQSSIRQFNIRYRVVLLTSDPVGLLPYNSTITFSLTFQDLYTLLPIDNDTSHVTFEILNGSSWYFSIVWNGAFQEYTLDVETYNHPELFVGTQYSLLVRMSYDMISPFYSSDDTYLTFELRPRASELDLEEAPTSTAYLEYANFTVFYRDADSSLGIIAYSITVSKGVTPLTLGSQYIIDNIGVGYYTISVNTTALDGLGLTLLTVYASWNPSNPPYHENASYSLNIRVVRRDANIEILSPPSLTWYDDNVTFTFSYIDLLKNIPIDGITSSDIDVYADGTLLVPGQFTLTEMGGVYTLEVNSSILSPNLVSNYNLTLFIDWNDATPPFYFDDQTLVRITTTNRQMSYSADPVTDTDFGLNLTISFVITDSGTGIPISGALISFDAQTISLTENVDFWITEGTGPNAGRYTIEVNSTSLIDPGTYYFDLNITWTGIPYYKNLISLEMSGIIRGTPTSLVVITATATAFWKDDASLSVQFNDSITGNLIPGAIVNWTWPGIGSGGFTDLGEGSYLAQLDTSLTSSTGTYVITVSASKERFRDAVGFITLVVRNLQADMGVVDPEEPIIFIPRGSGLNVSIYITDELGNPLPQSYVISVSAELESYSIPLMSNGTLGFYVGTFPSNGPTVIDPGASSNVRITAVLRNYDPATASFQISITTTKTALELWGDTSEDVTATYSTLVEFIVKLTAPDLSIDIDNATVTWVLSEKGLNGTLISLGYDGLFSVIFNTTEVGYGIWGISFRASPRDPIFSGSSARLSLTIKRITTDVLEPTDISVTWGWSGNLSFTFEGQFGNVDGATVAFSWADFRGNATEIGNGTYIVHIDTSLVTPGSYTLSMLFSKANYQEGPASVKIDVLSVPTEIVVESIEYTPIYTGALTSLTQLQLPIGDAIAIILFYNDTDNQDGYIGGLEGAQLTTNSFLSHSEIGYLDFDVTALSDGFYSLFLDTGDVEFNASIGVRYRFFIEFELANRSKSFIVIVIDVVEIPTEVLVMNDQVTWTIINGELVDGDSPAIILYFNDTWHNRGVTGAYLELESTNPAINLTYIEGSDAGTYYVYLNTGGLLQQGGGFVRMTIILDNFQKLTIERSITVVYNDFDRLVVNATFYGLPISILIIMTLLAYVRIWSVPKRVRQINGQIKAIKKGKAPKPIEDVKSRQQLVADLYNDTYRKLEITRTAELMPEESVPVSIPEMGELLIQLSILTRLSPEELDEFKADIAKMKLSEQAAFVKEVIDQEAVRAARQQGKSFEQIISETTAEAKRRVSGGEHIPYLPEDEISEVSKVPEDEERVFDSESEDLKPTRKDITEFDYKDVATEDRLSLYELEELQSDLIRRGVPEHEISTIMEQAKTLSRELVEELLRSLGVTRD